MLDPAFVRDHHDLVRTALVNRGMDADALLDALSPLDERRRALIVEVENLKRDQNAAAAEVAKRKKAGEDVAALVDANRARGQQVKEKDAALQALEDERRNLLLLIPNVPHASVPVGRSADDNREVRRVGDPPALDFEPKPHWDLGPELGILDFERGTKIAGARFTVLMGQGARLARALINFMLDLHTREHGYTEVQPPFMANSASLTGTGNLPKFEQDLFKIAGDWDLYLVPTAEVPLTNLYRGEILDGRSLPLRYTAYTPCFRSEAGSYGADVRGLIRQHQFDKVELMSFTTPEQSYDELERLTGQRRARAAASEAAVSHGAPLHGRHGLRVREDLRHRSLAAEPEDVPGDFFLQQHRGLSGASGQHQAPAWRHRQGRLRPHAEWLGPRRRTHAHRHHGELPAEGWLDRDPRRASPVHGRLGAH